MKTLQQIYAENSMRIHERNKRLLGARVTFKMVDDIEVIVGDKPDFNGFVPIFWPNSMIPQLIPLDDLHRWASSGNKTVRYSKKVLLKDYFA